MITSLLAQLDSEESEVIYEFARLRSIEGWWLWATLISAVFVGSRKTSRRLVACSSPRVTTPLTRVGRWRRG